MAKFYIFDIDGTLCERDDTALMPGRAERLRSIVESGGRIALATNQGGVGLRHWMESGGFGEPENYPTANQVEGRVKRIFDVILDEVGQAVSYAIAYRYVAKSGNVSPFPDGESLYIPHPQGYIHYSWREDWRKPNGGMLTWLMDRDGYSKADTVMIGDRDEDRGAALSAGVDFVHADDFF